MITFDHVDRNYASASKNYQPRVPEHFNFAFDVIDARARAADKTALISVDAQSGEQTHISYSDLSRRSSQIAHGLNSLGLQRGDAACGIASDWIGTEVFTVVSSEDPSVSPGCTYTVDVTGTFDREITE